MFFFCSYCSKKNKNIELSDLQRNIENAKLEMYKVNTRYDCNCQAIVIQNKNNLDKRDTVSIFSLDLKIDTMYERSDTLVYLFSYYNKEGERIFTVINNEKNRYPYFYGVEFLKTEKEPTRFLIAESSYIDRSSIENWSQMDSMIQNCAIQNKAVLNEWLEKKVLKR